MKALFTILIIACTLTVSAQAIKRYTKTPTGYLMVLRQGDSLLPMLEQLAIKEKIPSAGITGLGFAGTIQLGFFNAATKDFDTKDFTVAELTSLVGSIAWKNGKPALHTHATIADKNLQVFGGHILSCTVGTGSLEIMITVYDKKRQRKRDESIGADVLSLD